MDLHCCISPKQMGTSLISQNKVVSVFLPFFIYSKTCLKQPLKRSPKIGFQDRPSLNAGQKHCRLLRKSILQYFRFALSYHLPLIPLFCLFLCGRLRQGLLLVKQQVDRIRSIEFKRVLQCVILFSVL